jgi:hypothetical protein
MRTDVAVPGSRLFSHVSAGLVARRKLLGGAGYAPKQLPSRRWEQTGLVDVPALGVRGGCGQAGARPDRIKTS